MFALDIIELPSFHKSYFKGYSILSCTIDSPQNHAYINYYNETCIRDHL